jgi:hypothetical protein
VNLYVTIITKYAKHIPELGRDRAFAKHITK